MTLTFTDTQRQRLKELDGTAPGDMEFRSAEERDRTFKVLHTELVRRNRERLERLRSQKGRPAVRLLEDLLASTLIAAGFIEVVTPIIMARGLLKRMNLTEEHPLWHQVFWVDAGRCLRPMLAPHLYYLLGHLQRLWPSPVRVFEVGPCFRKETRGAQHLEEFTMLNVVEMGPMSRPGERLEEMVRLVMEACNLDYRLEEETSDVYGTTVDVIAGDGYEVASGSTGPHALDGNWGVSEAWAGVGFGLERLVMAREGFTNIKRAGRGLIYLDGARLNI